MLGRRLRTRLDLIRPNTAKRVEERQDAQKAKHDNKAKARAFTPGDKVYLKNFGSGQSWFPGEIVKTTEPVSYHVRLADGRTRRCHQDHLRARVDNEETSEEVPDETTEDREVIPMPTTSETTDDPQSQPHEVELPTPIEESSPPASQVRYPRRNRKQRVYFEPQHT